MKAGDLITIRIHNEPHTYICFASIDKGIIKRIVPGLRQDQYIYYNIAHFKNWEKDLNCINE